MHKYQIPQIIIGVIKTLETANFEAFLVGGCVRDLLLDRKPKDWDITTNAKPEQIQAIFPKTVYENKYGTVAIITQSEDPTLKVIEATPYRLESKYSDKRHPDEVLFTSDLNEDLKRRDFTINAMALKIKNLPTACLSGRQGQAGEKRKTKNGEEIEIVDLFGGKEDLKNKIIKTVGKPEDRFSEDALRILRAIRLAAELDFKISEETLAAIKKQAALLKIIAAERIKDEFVKIIMSDNPKKALETMRETGVLKFVAPELEEGYGIEQNKAHSFTVWEHNLRSLEHAVSKKWPLEIRIAALLHDVAKPATRRWGEKGDWTFYGHDVVGAKMTAKILSKLKFSKKTIDLVSKLVRYHLFFSDTEKITLSAVRRLVRNVGTENIWDLMKVRFSDRVGMGRPKESPYRLRKYESMIEEAMRAPLSVTSLKLDGKRLMELLKIQPGPKVGQILNILFEEVLDEPEKNTEEYLEKRATELNNLPEKDLSNLAQKAKDKKTELEQAEIKEIRKKWWVK
ncbi:HD domain-containing protein [Candidatus Parcubacteria bacterium]|nr:MAG: HD domain-containing protein [Candidatus Parcubacteria bacterium]